MRDRKDLVLKSRKDIESFLHEYNNNYTTHAYTNKVYSMLTNLKPGTFIELDKLVSDTNLEMFIKSVCLYIIETKINTIEFSCDYTQVRKLIIL